ncbi:hypothetical protein [Neptunomonas sp.]|uniref:hypothetical protein n=1 Tax=Neptunomonas sp. TaxID=1971898 RepID=UPI00356A9250
METHQKQFESRKENPTYWHNKSHDLFVSARTLWNAMQENRGLEVNCLAAYKMLLGMSFELLIKAHCVGSGVKFADTHDLAALARTANFPISNDENGILKVLSEYIIWDGRYPVPKKAQHLENHWKNQKKVLNDKEKLGSLTVLFSNDKLDFEYFLPIWRKYSDLFMERYNWAAEGDCDLIGLADYVPNQF